MTQYVVVTDVDVSGVLSRRRRAWNYTGAHGLLWTPIQAAAAAGIGTEAAPVVVVVVE